MLTRAVLVLFAAIAFTSPTPPAGKAELKRIAVLSGEWAVADSKGEATDLRASYELVAGDSAVVERLFLGTPEETLTLYHLEGREVTVTQVSSRGAPARLALVDSVDMGDPDALVFEATSTTRGSGGLNRLALTFLESQGLRIEWSMQPEKGDPLIRTFELIRQDSVEELAARLSSLRVDVDTLAREIDGRLKRRVTSSRRGEPTVDYLERRTLPTGPGWNHSGVPLKIFLFDQTIPFASTHAAQGDEGMSVTHYPFVAGEECRVRFSAIGGHAFIAVVEEQRAPPRKITSIEEFAVDLEGGKYGPIIEKVVGMRWAESAAAVDWDLSRFAGKDLRIYFVDAVKNHYGQLGVSEISITERAPQER